MQEKKYKYKLCGDSNETVYHISGYSKLEKKKTNKKQIKRIQM